MERAYINAKEIRNVDSTVPVQVCYISDAKIFDRANEEISAEIVDCGLWAEILETQRDLKAAEDELITFGLSLLPSQVCAAKKRDIKKAALSE